MAIKSAMAFWLNWLPVLLQPPTCSWRGQITLQRPAPGHHSWSYAIKPSQDELQSHITFTEVKDCLWVSESAKPPNGHVTQSSSRHLHPPSLPDMPVRYSQTCAKKISLKEMMQCMIASAYAPTKLALRTETFTNNRDIEDISTARRLFGNSEGIGLNFPFYHVRISTMPNSGSFCNAAPSVFLKRKLREISWCYIRGKSCHLPFS